MFLKNTKKVQKANINKVLYLSVFLCITCNVRSFLGEGMKIVRKLFAERSVGGRRGKEIMICLQRRART